MSQKTLPIDVLGFDHVNLKTRDVERAIDFYTRLLGLRLVRADRSPDGTIRFASLRIGGALIDLQPHDGDWSAERTGLNHVCLLIEPVDLDALAARLRQLGVTITEGPVRRQGAYGYGMALYILDPDGHGIELKHHEYPQAPA